MHSFALISRIWFDSYSYVPINDYYYYQYWCQRLHTNTIWTLIWRPQEHRFYIIADVFAGILIQLNIYVMSEMLLRRSFWVKHSAVISSVNVALKKSNFQITKSCLPNNLLTDQSLCSILWLLSTSYKFLITDDYTLIVCKWERFEIMRLILLWINTNL